MITVDLVSCRQSRRPCSINSLPSSQVEAVDVEGFLSNQDSPKVNVVKSSIVYPSVIRAHTLPCSESKKERTQERCKLGLKFFPIHPSCLEEDTVSFPSGVADTGNPGVHLGV
jgi:hypothetical protein